MLTYKEWRTINENFGGPIPIGIATPTAIGMINPLDEAKKGKGKKKKMLGDVPPEEEVDKEEPDEEEEEDVEKDTEVKEKPEDGEEEEEEEDDEDKEKKPLFFCKKGKKCSKMNKKMKKEWHNSVMNQVNSDPNAKFSDGFSKYEEDALIAPTDPNTGLEDQQLKPGDVGWAPVPRVGGWFGG